MTDADELEVVGRLRGVFSSIGRDLHLGKGYSAELVAMGMASALVEWLCRDVGPAAAAEALQSAAADIRRQLAAGAPVETRH